ncbi:MAG: hypothetical protein Unbinned1643contig1000_27 [Prokaryotic dsDNA virus sp.]|nr:MAG: hypothetical protein Unbinned1643contig1000_27 [Prokaryotic dsDNA virus sp.]|tara:strand:- start:3645 stop:4244 length:600 start_codon:yes stop_codon:yes gene_type:complete
MKNILQPQLVEKSLTKKEFLNNITIKNYQECKSRNGIAYSADIYYKGKFVCDIIEAGQGGELKINPYSKVSKDKWEFDNTINAIFETIDKKELKIISSIKNEDGSFYSYVARLDSLLIEAVDDFCAKKDFEKNQKKGLLLDTNKKGEYRIISWGNVTIPTLLKKYGNKGRDVIQQGITKYKDKEDILNKEYLMSLGFTF